MTIEILAEDHALLQRLIGSGRFQSMSEAVHQVLTSLAEEEASDEAWKQELDGKIQRGFGDESAGRFRPAAEFLEELRVRQGR